MVQDRTGISFISISKGTASRISKLGIHGFQKFRFTNRPQRCLTFGGSQSAANIHRNTVLALLFATTESKARLKLRSISIWGKIFLLMPSPIINFVCRPWLKKTKRKMSNWDVKDCLLFQKLTWDFFDGKMRASISNRKIIWPCIQISIQFSN